MGNTESNSGGGGVGICGSTKPKKQSPLDNKEDENVKNACIDILKENTTKKQTQEILDLKNFLRNVTKLKRNFLPSDLRMKTNSSSVVEVANELAFRITNYIISKEQNLNLYDSQGMNTDLQRLYYKDIPNWNEKINNLNPEGPIPEVGDIDEASNIIDSSMSYESSLFNSSKQSNSTENLIKQKSILNMSKSLYKSPQNKKNKLSDRSKPKPTKKKPSNLSQGKWGGRLSDVDKKMLDKNNTKQWFRTSKYSKMNNSKSMLGENNASIKNGRNMIKNFNTNKFAKKFNEEMEKNTRFRKKLNKTIDDTKANEKSENEHIITIDLRNLNTEESLENVDIAELPSKEGTTRYQKLASNRSKKGDNISVTSGEHGNKLKKQYGVINQTPTSALDKQKFTSKKLAYDNMTSTHKLDKLKSGLSSNKISLHSSSLGIGRIKEESNFKSSKIFDLQKYSVDLSALKSNKNSQLVEVLKSFKESNLFLFETTQEELKMSEVFENFGHKKEEVESDQEINVLDYIKSK